MGDIEKRLSIIVEVRTSTPSQAALEAAAEVARAMGAELKSIFVEDNELRDVANLSCARAVSFSGRASGRLDLDTLEHEMQLASAAVRREIERMARLADIPCRFDVVAGNPLRTLAEHAAQSAMLALAEPMTPALASRLEALTGELRGLMGLVLAGPRARRRSGPIVAVVEDVSQLESILATARRLISPSRRAIVLLLVGEDARERAALEEQARALLKGLSAPEVTEVRSMLADAELLAGVLKRLGGSFLVAQLGGMLAPGRQVLPQFAAAIECPVVLLR